MRFFYLVCALGLALLGALLDVISRVAVRTGEAAAAGRDWAYGMALLIAWRM
jgi:hypothetical protein